MAHFNLDKQRKLTNNGKRLSAAAHSRII